MSTHDLLVRELDARGLERACCRLARLTGAVRMMLVAGGLGSELPTDTARLVAREIVTLLDIPCAVDVAREPGYARVRLTPTAIAAVLRRTGLVLADGQLVLGLPPRIVTGRPCDAPATWAGALAVAGQLSTRNGVPAVTIVVPSTELVLAFSGLARTFGVPVRAKEARQGWVLGVRTAEPCRELLTAVGAPDCAEALVMRAAQSAPVSRGGTGTAVLADSNRSRVLEASERMAAAAQDALDALGDDVPAHLVAAARLRIDNPTLSLEELGRIADPPMTKDSIAGRLRRLLEMPGRASAS